MNLLWQQKLCNLQQLKIAVFTYRSPIIVFPGDAPGAITLNVVWMKRKFDAYKLYRSMYPSIFNSFPVIRTASAKKSPFSRTAAHIFVSPGDAHATITQLCCMDGKTIQCLPNASLHVPIYLQQFPSYTMLKSMRKSKIRKFYLIFVSHEDAPGAITLNAVWMEREFDAYKLSCSMYPSIFNGFSYSNRKCKKIAFFTYRSPHFCFPWRRPCDYHAICCTDGKTRSPAGAGIANRPLVFWGIFLIFGRLSIY